MLPDFKKPKRALRRQLQQRLRHTEANASGIPLHEIAHTIYHEGTESELTREDGTVARSEPKRLSEVVTFDTADLQGLTVKDIVAQVDDVAIRMASKKLQLLVDEVEKSAASFDAGGKPVTPEVLFGMMEAMEWTFQEDGTPSPRWLFSPNPKINRKLQAVLEQIDKDPELAARYGQIERQKREEWRAREADRKLVG